MYILAVNLILSVTEHLHIMLILILVISLITNPLLDLLYYFSLNRVRVYTQHFK